MNFKTKCLFHYTTTVPWLHLLRAVYAKWTRLPMSKCHFAISHWWFLLFSREKSKLCASERPTEESESASRNYAVDDVKKSSQRYLPEKYFPKRHNNLNKLIAWLATLPHTVFMAGQNLQSVHRQEYEHVRTRTNTYEYLILNKILSHKGSVFPPTSMHFWNIFLSIWSVKNCRFCKKVYSYLLS